MDNCCADTTLRAAQNGFPALAGFNFPKPNTSSVFEPPRTWQRATAALAVVLAVALGSVVTGGLVVVPVLGALSWWTALDALGAGGLAYLGYRLWGVLPAVSSGDPPMLRSLRQWLELAAVTGLAGATTAATLAWGAVLGWGSPFYAVVLPELAIVLMSTAVFAPFALVLPAALPADWRPTYQNRRRIGVREGAFWGGVVAPLVWLFGATALSLVSGNQQIQLFVGGVALSLVFATYRPRRERTDNRPPSAPSTDS